MNKTELDEIIRKHALWASGQGGARADLRDRYLSGADLHNVNLSRSDLNRANLSDASLIRADLSGVSLRGASLIRADLSGVSLRGASLIRADLYGANLSDADLSGANLSGADLSYANLSYANLSGSVGGPAYYSVSWSGHGERGRRLHAVEQDGQLMFSCGCFSGSESHLREYIKDGDQDYAASRLRALEIILELHDSTLGVPPEDGE